MNPTAMFIDLDGTLLSSEKLISKSDCMAMRQYMEYGGKIFIATGRSPVATSNLIRRLRLSGEYIAYNGACIYLGENQYKYFPLTQNELLQVLSIAAKHSLDIMLYTKDEVLVKKVASTNFYRISDTVCLQEFDLPEVFLDHLKVIETQQLHEAAESRCILKMALLPAPKGVFLNTYEEIRSLNLNAIFASKYIEITSASSNKYKGAAYILNKYSINMMDSLVIGDGENDLEILSYAGIGIAMANACDSVKRVAKHVVDTNNNSGVSEAIIKYALKETC